MTKTEGEDKFTIEDLNSAKERLDSLNDRDSGDTSGNPDKYHTRINSARAEIDNITEELKKQGDLPYSDDELMGQKLDAAFPRAQSKEVINFEGQSYKLQFYPLAKSRSGKSVQRWGKRWVKLS